MSIGEMGIVPYVNEYQVKFLTWLDSCPATPLAADVLGKLQSQLRQGQGVYACLVSVD